VEASLGLGSGDRFEGFRGGSGSFKGGVLQAEKPAELQEKRANGKEGVDGSSPSEGFEFLPA